ncbi:hypothetical protein JTE90_006935, partial [Oedothorax gibbosus]
CISNNPTPRDRTRDKTYSYGPRPPIWGNSPVRGLAGRVRSGTLTPKRPFPTPLRRFGVWFSRFPRRI